MGVVRCRIIAQNVGPIFLESCYAEVMMFYTEPQLLVKGTYDAAPAFLSSVANCHRWIGCRWLPRDAHFLSYNGSRWIGFRARQYSSRVRLGSNHRIFPRALAAPSLVLAGLLASSINTVDRS